MCYWGIYQAAKTNYRDENRYYRDQALAKAISLKNRASKSEQLYIEAGVAAEKDEKKDKNPTNSNEVQVLTNVYLELISTQAYQKKQL